MLASCSTTQFNHERLGTGNWDEGRVIKWMGVEKEGWTGCTPDKGNGNIRF